MCGSNHPASSRSVQVLEDFPLTSEYGGRQAQSGNSEREPLTGGLPVGEEFNNAYGKVGWAIQSGGDNRVGVKGG